MSYRMRRGLGAALDCSNVDGLIPVDSAYPFENCVPTDSNCVARNQRQDVLKMNAWQAYHDAVAACSAEKFKQSGGTLDLSKLTFGAGTDYTTGDVYTAPTASEAIYVAAGQPWQTGDQVKANALALAPYANAPTMFTPAAPAPARTPVISSAPPPAAPLTVTSSAVPPAKQPLQRLPGAYGNSLMIDDSNGQDMTGGPGFSFSSLPWWAWVAGGGVALLALKQR